jgi:hypothetical protein
LTTPCGRSSIPPTWWLSAWVAPSSALVKAMPASRLAWAISTAHSVREAVLVIRGRLAKISRTAFSACPSASRLLASEVNASMPWVSASRPVAAARSGGIVASRDGSVTEMSGTRARPMIVTLIAAAVSVTMQNCDTSAPVPAVEGTISSGGMGLRTRSIPL